MATLALAAAGAAAGSALLPAGISVLGATITGAAIGSQIGTFAGSYVDNALFGSSGQSRAVDLTCRIDTLNELKVWAAGGMMPFVLRRVSRVADKELA